VIRALVCWVFGHLRMRGKLRKRGSYLVSEPYCEHCESWLTP
jgi:hypothetical protein